MKFNYKLQRLCGAYYGHPCSAQTRQHVSSQWGGSNIIYNSTGDTLICPVSNRVQVIDLKSQTVRTLPMESRSNIRCIAISPDDALLMIIDVENYGMLVNFRRGVVIHRTKFKRKVRVVKFSPCGTYIALSYGKHVQVWYTPCPTEKQFCPMSLFHTYTGQSDDVTCIQWSTDSSGILAGSRDCTVRIWTTNIIKNYEAITLSGHKSYIVGAYFVYDVNNKNKIDGCYSISEDGALVSWKCSFDDDNSDGSNDPFAANTDDAVNFFTGKSGVPSFSLLSTSTSSVNTTMYESQARALVNATWSVENRHYFNQENVMATSYCTRNELLAVAFSSGVFGLYEMPSVANIHTLAVGGGTSSSELRSNQKIKTIVLNPSGDWLALGCPLSQHIMVWEWRSETYILKQRGHEHNMMRSMCYSPDGIVLCTGGEDGKIKLWNATSGFCYVTMPKAHTAPITAIKFAKSSVVVTASLDGTVRAHDLYRYRTFQTLTTPTPVQFISLAVDSNTNADIIMAGSKDPFHIYTWNLRTGKLLDIYTGHTGPVCSLDFYSSGILCSSSWDGTVKLWDIYKGGNSQENIAIENLRHTSDVICCVFRPSDGKELASSSMNGIISFWDVEHSKLKYEIDGRKDIIGGRKMHDKISSLNNASSKYFTSICYSPDGLFLLASGNSKYVCIYEISQQMLIKKFQITFNRSLDGVLDELNSSKLGDSGLPIDDEVNSEDETTYNALHLPGAKIADDGTRSSNGRVEVLTHQVSFSLTGREWAVISQEGLHIYGIDDDMIFDPISLSEEITPSAIENKLSIGDYSLALIMAIHLNEYTLVQQVLENTPYDSIQHVLSSPSLKSGINAGGGGKKNTEPVIYLDRLVQYLSKTMMNTPHVEFYLQWCLQLLSIHGMYMEKHRSTFMKAFRALHKVIQTKQDDIKTLCNENKYTLDYIVDQAQLNADTGTDEAVESMQE